jgi:hypothetical protein
MSPEDRPQLEDPPEASTPPREPTDEQTLLRLLQAHGRARRPRRRRRLILAGALVTASVLFTAVMSGTWHAEPPSTSSVMEPAEEPSSSASEPRATRTAPPAVQSVPPAAESVPPAAHSALPAAESAPPAVRSAQPAVRPGPPAIRKTARVPEPTRAAAAAPTPPTESVSYQPRERLATVRPGDAKHKIFELFATAFEQRIGSLVRIDGMRLRASGRSPHYAQVEVAEVKIADTAAGTPYWFLFGDGLLLAWGPPEEWSVASGRYQLEIDYRPNPSRTRRPGAS